MVSDVGVRHENLEKCQIALLDGKKKLFPKFIFFHFLTLKYRKDLLD